MSCSGCNALRRRQAKSFHRLFSSSVQTAQKVGHSRGSNQQTSCRGRGKRFTPPRIFVVEQQPVAGNHLTALLLRDLLHHAIELTGARLIDPRFLQ
jgi:hypothetical protein